MFPAATHMHKVGKVYDQWDSIAVARRPDGRLGNERAQNVQVALVDQV